MELTQNDLTVVVALTTVMSYAGPDDQIYSDFQISDDSCLSDGAGDEPASVCHHGRSGEYRQAFASRRLRRSGGARPAWLAQALGRNDFPRSRRFRHRHRNCAAFHAAGTNGLAGRYGGQSFGHGAGPDIFPYFLDTTPTLNRRFTCAA